MFIKEGKWDEAAVPMPITFCLYFDALPIFQGIVIKLHRGKASYLFDHNIIKNREKVSGNFEIEKTQNEV
jgi:hypothetical protein